MKGIRRHAPHVCAVCGGDIWDSPPKMAELGDGDTLVAVCTRCHDETPRELHGERGYTGGAGPSLKAADLDAAMRRTFGDARVERDHDIERRIGLVPAPAVNSDDRDHIDHIVETQRRNRTGANHYSNVKDAARRDVARKVTPRKRSRP